MYVHSPINISCSVGKSQYLCHDFGAARTRVGEFSVVRKGPWNAKRAATGTVSHIFDATGPPAPSIHLAANTVTMTRTVLTLTLVATFSEPAQLG